jgi:hypothetical protein
MHKGVPIQAHPDFTFITPQGEITVVELKSCERLPDTAYAAHEMQLFGQLGLLASLWPEPHFSLDNAENLRSFPALVKQALGISLPKQAALYGWILCVSMNGAKAFGPYAPNNLMLSACLDLAGKIWGGLEKVRAGAGLDDLPTTRGFSPLCDWCEWNADCPSFTGVSAPDLEDELREWQRLKAEKETLDSRLQELDGQIRAVCKAHKGEWLTAETLRVRLITCEGKRSFNKERLESELTTHLDAGLVSSLMAAAHQQGKPYDRLMVGNLN